MVDDKLFNDAVLADGRGQLQIYELRLHLLLMVDCGYENVHFVFLYLPVLSKFDIANDRTESWANYLEESAFGLA